MVKTRPSTTARAMVRFNGLKAFFMCCADQVKLGLRKYTGCWLGVKDDCTNGGFGLINGRMEGMVVGNGLGYTGSPCHRSSSYYNSFNRIM